MIEDARFWRSYAGQMLSLARTAKSPRVKAVWLAGAARARRELIAARTKPTPTQGSLDL